MGGIMANGKAVRHGAVFAAHRTLPLGTRVDVVNLRNHRSLVVPITDRGPFVAGRVIDVSFTAAKILGLIGPGHAPVALHVVSDSWRPDDSAQAAPLAAAMPAASPHGRPAASPEAVPVPIPRPFLLEVAQNATN
jgi:rare lipoprotein A